MPKTATGPIRFRRIPSQFTGHEGKAMKNKSDANDCYGASDCSQDVPIVLEIKSCHDCPRFKSIKRYAPNRFPYFGEFMGYEYRCTQAGREIVNGRDAVNPPPKWCPKRSSKDSEDG